MAVVARWPFSLLDRLEGKESATFKRLGKSRHVADLRTIVFVTGGIIVFFWAVAILEFIGLSLAYHTHLFFQKPPEHKFEESMKDCVRFIGATGTLGAIVLAWAYQAGSKRLGVVDLFACEIATLCRVGTVARFIHNLIAQHKAVGSNRSVDVQDSAAGAPDSAKALRFSSEENYFPVFEGNAKDLQILDADVVNNVTAFYTYMKATRDMLRRLSDLRAAKAGEQEERKAILNLIYMVFLAYESARLSIDQLIEFDPTHAECKMVILFTELPAYRFLLDKLPDDQIECDDQSDCDVRAKRLDLRWDSYTETMKDLFDTVKANTRDPDWKKPVSMLEGLQLLSKRTFSSRSPASVGATELAATAKAA